MLIEFSVENHRAFREKQTFSMVASTGAERTAADHVVHTGFAAVPCVLREACLLGANGAGKSSLIGAMAFMSGFVRNSFRNDAGHGIGVEPFVFHSEWRDKPSEFEAIFIHENTLYQYGFSVTGERVVEEWLFARPRHTGRQRNLFTRIYNAEKGSYDWNISNTRLKGERDSWKAQTRPESLFLSTAVQLNAEGLKGAHEWLSKRFKMILPTRDMLSDEYTASRFEDEGWKTKVIGFLKSADIALHDIQVEEKSLFDLTEFKSLPEAIKNEIRKQSPDAQAHLVSFVRQDDQNSSIPLRLQEESSGTRALFALAGPILDVLENGFTVAVDELNTGLHPLALRYLVALFCDTRVNRHDAQLIFTTHDTSVTEHSCIGKDHVWLVEKQDDLAAHLIPLSDFKTRGGRSFQKGYLQGRFGAIPYTSDEHGKIQA